MNITFFSFQLEQRAFHPQTLNQTILYILEVILNKLLLILILFTLTYLHLYLSMLLKLLFFFLPQFSHFSILPSFSLFNLKRIDISQFLYPRIFECFLLHFLILISGLMELHKGIMYHYLYLRKPCIIYCLNV